MKSKVYYSKDNFNKILGKLPGDLKGKIGIKVHVGEMGNVTYLKPKYAEAVYNKLSLRCISYRVQCIVSWQQN